MIEERDVSISEIIDAIENGTLLECFGTGTAAVIAPVSELSYKNKPYVINNGEIGNLTKRLYDTLTGIQYGKIKDKFGWVFKV